MNNVGFDQIKFPVFHLGSEQPITEDRITFYLFNKHHYDGTIDNYKLVVDDKNLSGHSLAMRRLQLRDTNHKMFKFKYAIFFISDLIKMTKHGNWFIDSEGQIFEYTKTKRVPLVFRPIIQMIPVRTGGCIVEVQGEGTRFKTLHAPSGLEKYAGLLLVGKGSILYGLYNDKLPDTVRMI